MHTLTNIKLLMKSTSKFPNRSTHNQRKRKAKNFGREVIAHSGIPHFKINNEDPSCSAATVARNFVRQQNITQSVVLSVVAAENTEEFFWTKSGLYSLKYVTINYPEFPELAEAANRYRNLKKKQSKNKSIGFGVNNQPI